MVNCICNLTNMLSIEYNGIVNASITGSTELTRLLSTCDDPNQEKTLKGASTGSISITAYPYAQGDDKYLDVLCESSAQVSINYVNKYDCESEVTHFIMQKGGQASRTGDPITGITISDEVCNYRDMSADASSNPVTPYLDITKYDGYGMVSTLRPLPFDSGVNQTYTILGIEAMLQSFSVNVSFPKGAVATYSFVYSIAGC